MNIIRNIRELDDAELEVVAGGIGVTKQTDHASSRVIDPGGGRTLSTYEKTLILLHKAVGA
jgi:hypothetical protein